MASSQFEERKLWHVGDGKPTYWDIVSKRGGIGTFARVPWKAIVKLETYKNENKRYELQMSDSVCRQWVDVWYQVSSGGNEWEREQHQGVVSMV